MADITTDILIIGTGPAGSASAALLSSYGVENMVINRHRWLANSPRAHIPTSARWRCCAIWGRRSRAKRICTPRPMT